MPRYEWQANRNPDSTGWKGTSVVKSTKDIDLNNAQVKNAGEPEDNDDLATKQYVDLAVLNAGAGEGGSSLTSYSQIEDLPGYPEKFDTDIAHVEGVTEIGEGLMAATDSLALRNSIGLEQVNNTSDLDKPVSNAQQNLFDLKADLNSPTFTGTVGGIDKTMVGLGSVDNTSDADKPLSNAATGALGAKADSDYVAGLEARLAALESTNAAGFLVVQDTDEIPEGTPAGTPIIRITDGFTPVPEG